MIQKLRNWLVRQRDQTAVSYSRFGRPGEEEDDKPPPTTIVVAPFNENAPEFHLFGVCHVQKAAVYFTCFGMAMCILSFITTFFEFDWYSHTRGVDVGALLGLFLYLALGVLIHYYVIYGIKKQLSRYLLPFIAVYSIVCIFEVFICLALLFKTIEPDEHLPVTTATQIHGTQKGQPYALILLGMLVVLCIQAIMLAAVLRCRQFLSQKQENEMALKVAEKSKQEFPGIQIVIGNPGSINTIGGINSSMSPASPPPTPINARNGGNDINGSGPNSSSNPIGAHDLLQNGKPQTPPPIIPNLL